MEPSISVFSRRRPLIRLMIVFSSRANGILSCAFSVRIFTGSVFRYQLLAVLPTPSLNITSFASRTLSLASKLAILCSRRPLPSFVPAANNMFGAARVAGDGASIPSIKLSISVSALGDEDKPKSLRTIRLTAPVNFSQPDILPPSTRVSANALWNSGLLKASATNSSKFCVP